MSIVELSRCQRKTLDISKIEDVLPHARDGWVVDSVDEIDCRGLCEDCGLPILEGQQYYRDEEGVIWHAACELSPHPVGTIPETSPGPLSMLNAYTPDSTPATEQPEEEPSVTGLRAQAFTSVCDVVEANQRMQARIVELEATITKIRNARIPEYDDLKLENTELKARAKQLKDALGPLIKWWETMKRTADVIPVEELEPDDEVLEALGSPETGSLHVTVAQLDRIAELVGGGM